MPSFSSTRSLIREMVSSDSMSISISLPVSVLTLICAQARPRSVRHNKQKVQRERELLASAQPAPSVGSAFWARALCALQRVASG